VNVVVQIVGLATGAVALSTALVVLMKQIQGVHSQLNSHLEFLTDAIATRDARIEALTIELGLSNREVPPSPPPPVVIL